LIRQIKENKTYKRKEERRKKQENKNTKFHKYKVSAKLLFLMH
jgi:hypothetical protein